MKKLYIFILALCMALLPIVSNAEQKYDDEDWLSAPALVNGITAVGTFAYSITTLALQNAGYGSLGIVGAILLSEFTGETAKKIYCESNDLKCRFNYSFYKQGN